MSGRLAKVMPLADGGNERPAKQALQFHCIDLLRGVAALSVAIYHARVYLWVGSREILGHPAIYGWGDRLFAFLMLPSFFLDSGVVLFFVVSGFCVHWPTASRIAALEEGQQRGEKPDKVKWNSYLVRRFFRLYPPYLAAVILTLGAEFAATRFAGPEKSPLPLFWHSVAMLQNYLPPQGQMIGNPALWSVPVEAELYLAYPILLLARRKMGWSWTLGVAMVVSLTASHYAVGSYTWLAGCFLKWWAIWGAGAALAEVVSRGRLPRFGFGLAMCMTAALVSATVLAAAGDVHRPAYLLYGMGFVMLLWWLISREMGSVPAPRWAPGTGLRFVGQWSYSLYLVHFPLFFFIGNWWTANGGTKPQGPWLGLMALGVASLVAFVFYRGIELPFHRLARRLAKGIS